MSPGGEIGRRVGGGFPRVSGDEPSTVSGVVELNAVFPA